MLETELNLYHKIKAQLQAENPNGGFVVIKDETVLGVWQTRIDALKAGLDKFGDVSFLVKDIDENIFAANLTRELKFV
jgi:hypothetical protein